MAAVSYQFQYENEGNMSFFLALIHSNGTINLMLVKTQVRDFSQALSEAIYLFYGNISLRDYLLILTVWSRKKESWKNEFPRLSIAMYLA